MFDLNLGAECRPGGPVGQRHCSCIVFYTQSSPPPPFSPGAAPSTLKTMHFVYLFVIVLFFVFLWAGILLLFAQMNNVVITVTVARRCKFHVCEYAWTRVSSRTFLLSTVEYAPSKMLVKMPIPYEVKSRWSSLVDVKLSTLATISDLLESVVRLRHGLLWRKWSTINIFVIKPLFNIGGYLRDRYISIVALP